MYKSASKLKLRFAITIAILGTYASKIATGSMSLEQLWELPIPVLDRLSYDLEDKYKASGNRSRLVKKSKKDKTLKLQMDIVIDILETKVDEKETADNAKDKKTYNQNILGLIEDKKNEEMKEMSVKELERLLKK